MFYKIKELRLFIQQEISSHIHVNFVGTYSNVIMDKIENSDNNSLHNKIRIKKFLFSRYLVVF
jgi:hypothetical protein